MPFFYKTQKKNRPPILDLLIAESFLDKESLEQVEFLLNNTELGLEEVLLKFVSRANLLLCKAITFKNKYKVFDLIADSNKIDTRCLCALSPNQMQKYGVVVLKKQNGLLDVAMDNPENYESIDVVEKITGCSVAVRYITLASDIKMLLKTIEAAENNEKLENGGGEENTPPQKENTAPAAVSIESFTIGGDSTTEIFTGVRPIVDAIIKQGLYRGASDIHIEPGRNGVDVRFRIDGILTSDPRIDSILDKAGRDKKLHDNILNIIKNRSGESGKTMRLDETEKPQDGRIYIPEIDLDLRVSVIPTILGESVVIRIHYREIGRYSLDKLGFEAQVFKKIKKIIQAPYGIILVAGPTGSGKTTTLYSIIQMLNSPKKKIITIEDPVEYSITGTIQAQINLAKDFTFNSALRSFLRHDPDIIMVGEIRDVSTASMAMEAALTGHLVLSSIHANDAVTTLHRLRDLGVDPRLVTATCLATIGQRLVRRVCQSCQRAHVFSTRLYQAFDQFGIKYNPRKLVKGSGCEQCNFTGFHGRIGLFELLNMTYEIKELFLKDASVEEITEMAVKQGMKTLLEDALTKVSHGITTEEEVWRVTLLEGHDGE